MPYTVRVITGSSSDAGFDGEAWIRVFSTTTSSPTTTGGGGAGVGASSRKDTGRMPLQLANGRHFSPRSDETFSLEGAQLKYVKQIEVTSQQCV